MQVIDNLLGNPKRVRQSALDSGFGSWRPKKGAIGSSVYDGMNFYGDHASIIEAIYKKIGMVGYPNSMCFRVTNETTERAYVHSDVTAGDTTCILYLSEHSEGYGTGFYRHKRTGSMVMPPLKEISDLATLQAEINDSSAEHWEEVEFVKGVFNRAVIFRSHRYHRRFPEHGLGTDENSGRMIHITHFKDGSHD
jgi:hypothetical protein